MTPKVPTSTTTAMTTKSAPEMTKYSNIHTTAVKAIQGGGRVEWRRPRAPAGGLAWAIGCGVLCVYFWFASAPETTDSLGALQSIGHIYPSWSSPTRRELRCIWAGLVRGERHHGRDRKVLLETRRRILELPCRRQIRSRQTLDFGLFPRHRLGLGAPSFVVSLLLLDRSYRIKNWLEIRAERWDCGRWRNCGLWRNRGWWRNRSWWLGGWRVSTR